MNSRKWEIVNVSKWNAFSHPKGKVIGEIRGERRNGVFSLAAVPFTLEPREGAALLLHVTCCLHRAAEYATRCNVMCELWQQPTVNVTVMNFITKPLYNHAKLLMLLSFALAVLLAGIVLRNNTKQLQLATLDDVLESADNSEYDSQTNATTKPGKTRRKEYLYRLLTNTTRSLIQMEIKARRLEENMRSIKEKTADLLWKNKDKALWHILFKNISRHISIRHEFHQHSSLRRIMQDTHTAAHSKARRKVFLS